jgi:class 3 adenylate cyclase
MRALLAAWLRHPDAYAAAAAAACGFGAMIVAREAGARAPVAVGVQGLAIALAAATALAFFAARRATREAQGLASMRREVEWLSATFSRYFSPQVARLIAERGQGALVSGRREVSVLFADLAGFTRYSERHPAEVVASTLAAYLDELARVALMHDGTIDKFMGDEIMVVFNAPADQPDHARRALACARDMQLVVALLDTERAHRGQVSLDLTIGVNTGEAVVGHFGGERRLQYTVIGDVVNVAKRLQGLAEDGQIVAAAETFAAAGELPTRIEEHTVRGRQAVVSVGRIHGATMQADEGRSNRRSGERREHREGRAVAV